MKNSKKKTKKKLSNKKSTKDNSTLNLSHTSKGVKRKATLVMINESSLMSPTPSKKTRMTSEDPQQQVISSTNDYNASLISRHSRRNKKTMKNKTIGLEPEPKKLREAQPGMQITHFTEGSRSERGSSLREKMMNRLQGARFRYLNEQMYTLDGNKANQLFKKDSQAFEAYHEGFQQQVTQWKMNPLDCIIKNLKRKSDKLVVADFGCGDARLAQCLSNQVHSFDLVAMNERVTACNMAHTPLKDESVDIVVFCLSLMGTNLSEYLREANRVLKEKGLMKIAEVESRFENVEKFIKDLKKFGFRITWKNLDNEYFYLMDFNKESSMKKKSKLPVINLKPCIYKKR